MDPDRWTTRPSRRQLLGGLVGTAVVGGGLSQVSLGPINAHQPAAGTWPLDRYGPANTGANPDATVPAEPTVAWEATVPSSDYPDHRLVVGPESVYVAGRVTTALARNSGEVQWQYEAPTTQLALDDGTLYAYGEETQSAARGPIALDPADATVDWRTEGGNVYDHLVPAEETLFAGYGRELAAYDADSGTQRWHRSMDGGIPEGGPAIRGGTLYALGGDLVAFGSRSAGDAALENPPPVDWQRSYSINAPVPVATDDRLVATRYVELPHDRPILAAFDPATGEQVWSALRPDVLARADGSEGEYVERGYEYPRPPAVVGDRGVVALDVYETGDPPPETHLVGFSVADGSIRWHRTFATGTADVIATGASVVVATYTASEAAEPPRGSVRAFDDETGEERWRRPFTHGVQSLAAVGETVFATTNGGRVVAIR